MNRIYRLYNNNSIMKFSSISVQVVFSLFFFGVIFAKVELYWDDNIGDPGAEDCGHCGSLYVEVVAACKTSLHLYNK